MLDLLQEMTNEGISEANRCTRRAIDKGDVPALRELLHPNFIINGPNNRCGARDQLLGLSAGATAGGKCRTVIERTALTGNLGILMGDEVMEAAEGNLLAEWFGTGPVRRRFTEVYIFEDGKWLLLARHASVVREANEFYV
jgi:hypothetical protein